MKLQVILNKIAKIRTAEKLCAYAFDNFSAMLPEENGKTWLRKKISYLAYDKLKGPLTGKALERAEALDTEAKIKELLMKDKASPSVPI